MSSRKRKNLDAYLAEIFNQYIAIKDDDYKTSQEVFKHVFDEVRAKIGEKCNYFKKYSSQVMNAGSVYDGIKVSKLDEFDMDIVIRLPINYNDIIIENDQAGFVKLKIEEAFDHLDKQPDWEKCHVVTRDWRDSEKYFLQNKFRYWMHSVVQKALNDLNGQVKVKDVTYMVELGKQSGPAHTLFIKNFDSEEPFKLDVDLVPVIRFMHPRWLEGYRNVEGNQVKEWLVVPKPNKALEGNAQNRSWRLSFQEFEREMMKGCQQLKTTIRLVKKLRDSLKLDAIASYYIKTLFLWKIDETKDRKYWQKALSVLFREMVQELHNAIKEKTIKYFWHEENNLIESLKPTLQKIYVDKLKRVLDAIDNSDVDAVAAYLLAPDELQKFKMSDFYQKQTELQLQRQLTSSSPSGISSPLSRHESIISQNSIDLTDSQNQDASLMDLVKGLNDKVTAMADDQKRLQKIEADSKGSTTRLNTVVDMLKQINAKLDDQNERLYKLEAEILKERDEFKDQLEMLFNKLDIQNERLMKMEMTMVMDHRNKNLLKSGTVEIDHNTIRLTGGEEKEGDFVGI